MALDIGRGKVMQSQRMKKKRQGGLYRAKNLAGPWLVNE